ncbi:hypothetical protein CVT26_004237 [Gymnopilus dilepis]|uniref:Uncharacterized protein n=1 Tax=Gymnopilus dilepis TaxID=231916 RepID=A0A409YN12_9AGAR|nr:hypothetical protein CVT26_004237 [Gymnopilus dilepis]
MSSTASASVRATRSVVSRALFSSSGLLVSDGMLNVEERMFCQPSRTYAPVRPPANDTPPLSSDARVFSSAKRGSNRTRRELSSSLTSWDSMGPAIECVVIS